MSPDASRTRAGRVLRRTLSGGALVAAVAGVLLWIALSPDGRPILVVSALILGFAAWEASRMGALALRNLFPPLLLAGVGAILLLFAAIEGAGRVALDVTPLDEVYRPDLAFEYLFCAAVAAAAYALGWTLPRLLGRSAALSRSIVYLAVGGVVVFATLDPLEVRARAAPALVALGILLAACLPALLRRPGGARGLAIAVGLAVWIVPPLPALWHVWSVWSTSGLVSLLLLAKIGDTAGYYVGTAIGRRHPFPTISPGKTVEGCLGSLAAGTLAGAGCVALGWIPGSIPAGLAAGAVLNLAAQSGDLLESWVKRRSGVKDSSSLFGPSGGLLDQLDSLLLAIPVAVVVWPWILPPGVD